MKTNQIILTALLWSICTSAFSQINYQAIVRDLNGSPLIEETVDFDVQILQEGNSVYSESHPAQNTGTLGLVNLSIGTGLNPSGPFDELDWSQGDFSISVSVNGELLPASPIHSVPVAEYAKNSLWNQNEDESISYTSGNVGVNTENPSSSFHVNGISTFTNTDNASSLLNLGANSDTQDNWISSFDENNERQWVVNLLDRSHDNGFGIFSDEIEHYVFRINTAGKGQFYRGLSITNVSDSEMLRFSSNASNQDAHIRSFDNNGNAQWIINLMDRSHDNRFGIFSEVTNQYEFRILHSGLTEVRCLKILGGYDIKEDFDSNENLLPGEVVVLDEASSGKLKRTTEPYDKRLLVSSAVPMAFNRE